MKNILVPTDFSEVSKNALHFAIKISQPLKSNIILFHSDQPILATGDTGEFTYDNSLEKDYTKEINRNMDELIEYANLYNISSKKRIHKGLLIDDIATIEEDEKIDLIISGTKGMKDIKKLILGTTNSISIFEKVKCPVLIVPLEAKYHGIKKIMYATNFQYGDIKELSKICAVAKKFNAEVIITHINTNPEKFEQEEEGLDWFAEIGRDNIPYDKITYRLLYNDNVLEGLEKTIDELDIDILCMSTTEKSFFENLFTKSNTKNMAYHSRIPLLVLHLSSNHTFAQ
ncbi:MAG TPA: universal stress protein [Cytophagaceae bacterium]|jgi:nucleotide-binding universal stress UspA family protein|nr:universal stress protein [Cytophagaceae bacterium]